MISFVIFTFSVFERVTAFILQLFAFHAFVVEPSPDIPLTSPSTPDPSPLHTGRDLATTIQFPAGTRGYSGFLPVTAEVPQKHKAAPIPRVSVGVT
jgi:hypothetical protein